MKISTRRATRLGAGLLALALGLGLAGCSTGPAETEENTATGVESLAGLDIAFALATSAAQVYTDQLEEFQRMAEEVGANVEVYDNLGSAETMLTNAELIVAAQPDVVIEMAPVADATDRVGDIFTAAGLPCIAVNVPVKGCDLLNFDQPYLGALGADAMAIKMQERGWDASNTTVIIGQASALGESVNIAVTSFYSALSKQIEGMTPVETSEITASTTTISGDEGYQADTGVGLDTSYDAISKALQTIPAGNNLVIYTVGDDAAAGALRALDAAGRTSTAMISSYGGSDAALEAVRAGDVWVTEQMGFWNQWGEFMLAMIVAQRQGLEIPELTAPPMIVLTSENVDTFFSPEDNSLLQMPELPENSQYLIETGVLQYFGNVAGVS